MSRGTLRSGIARTVLAAAMLGAAVALAVGVLLPGNRIALGLVFGGTLVLAWAASAEVSRRLAAPLERLAATSARSRPATTRPGPPSEAHARSGSSPTRSTPWPPRSRARSLRSAPRSGASRSSSRTSATSCGPRSPRSAVPRKRCSTATSTRTTSSASSPRIASEAERLTRLANDLLTLQRIEGATGELPLRRVDLRVAVDRAGLMFEPILEERGATLTVNGKAPLVLGDLDRLQQVIANLVDNASRIAGEGGHVTVELSQTEDGDARIAISDNGPGIADEDLARLFDRFYKTDMSRTRSGGSGLGLAIVKAIVSMHGGTVTAENLPERGSRFTVVLARAARPGRESRASRPPRR